MLMKLRHTFAKLVCMALLLLLTVGFTGAQAEANPLSDFEYTIWNDRVLLTKYKSEFKKIELAVANTKRVNQLRALWTDVPSQAFTDLDSNQSVPFVTMMIGLAKRHYRVQPLSMFLFWRRMCATGQDNIFTYFSWSR